MLRGESHIGFRAKYVIMMLLGAAKGRGLLVKLKFDALKFRKLLNFKVHEWSWTVNEFCSWLIIDEKILSNIYKISKNIVKLISY